MQRNVWLHAVWFINIQPPQDPWMSSISSGKYHPPCLRVTVTQICFSRTEARDSCRHLLPGKLLTMRYVLLGILPVQHPWWTNMGCPLIAKSSEITCREMSFAPKTESAPSVWIWAVTQETRSLLTLGKPKPHSLEADSKTKARAETTSTAREVPMAYRDVLRS